MTDVNGLANPFENAVLSLNEQQLTKQKRLDDYTEAVGGGYEPPAEILAAIAAILEQGELGLDALAELESLVDEILQDLAPEITSNGGGDTATIDFAENSTEIVTKVVALDKYSLNDAEGGLTYSIIGGADANLFSIHEESGELIFLAPPDYEAIDGLLEVTVQVSDGGILVDTQTISVNVTDVPELEAFDDTVALSTVGENVLLDFESFPNLSETYEGFDFTGFNLSGGGNDSVLAARAVVFAGNTSRTISQADGAVFALESLDVSSLDRRGTAEILFIGYRDGVEVARTTISFGTSDFRVYKTVDFTSLSAEWANVDNVAVSSAQDSAESIRVDNVALIGPANNENFIRDIDVLGNDFDVKEGALVSVAAFSALGAALSVNLDGTVRYDSTNAVGADALAAGELGTDSFSYTVENPDGSTSTATVTVDLSGRNDAPEAVADILTATEDTAVTYTAGELLGNDIDIDGTSEALQIISVASGTGGTTVLNFDGTVTFTPNADFNGEANFSYRVSDGSAEAEQVGNVTVNVAAVNDAPRLSYVTDVPIYAGALSSWDAEGNAFDSIGVNGFNNGVLVNGVGFTGGVSGQAFSFDGVNDFVSVTREIQDDFTISFWVNTTTGTGFNGSQFFQGQGLVYADVPGFANDFGVSLVGDKVAFGVGGPSSATTVLSTTSVTTGEWFHVDAVRDGAGISLYINGVLEAASVSPYGGPLSSPAQITFGANTVDRRYFEGELDSITIYDRALTVEELEFDFNPQIATSQDTPIVLSGLGVSDPDAAEGANEVMVEMLVGNGTLDFGHAGLVDISGTGTGALTIQGALDDVELALATLTYTPGDGFIGNDALEVTVNDLGNTGAPGPLEDTITLSIDVFDFV